MTNRTPSGPEIDETVVGARTDGRALHREASEHSHAERGADMVKKEDYAPIACTDYDVLELVCMDAAEIELMLDDRVVTGTALTLENDASAEYLVLREAGDGKSRIRIDRIRRLVVRSRPARLETHDFGPR